MIQLVTGRPRQGKGVLLNKWNIRTLLHTERYLVTNLPQDLSILAEYLESQGFKGDLNKRIRVLTTDEVWEFWRFRSADVVWPESPDLLRRGDKEKPKIDRRELLSWCDQIFSQGPKGVVFRIDEVHKYYRATEWASIGRTVDYYLTQHAHCHDNIDFASQYPTQIYNAVRDLCQFRIDVEHKALRRTFGGLVRGKDVRLASWYLGCPKVVNGEGWIEQTEFKVDPAEANCYRTTGALGGEDVGPEEAVKLRGIDERVVRGGILVGALCVMAFLVWGIPKMPMLLGRWLNQGAQRIQNAGSVPGTPASAPAASSPASTVPASSPAASSAPASTPASTEVASTSPQKTEGVVGVGFNGDRAMAWGENGTVWRSGPQTQIYTYGVRHLGRWHELLSMRESWERLPADSRGKGRPIERDSGSESADSSVGAALVARNHADDPEGWVRGEDGILRFEGKLGQVGKVSSELETLMR